MEVKGYTHLVQDGSIRCHLECRHAVGPCSQHSKCWWQQHHHCLRLLHTRLARLVDELGCPVGLDGLHAAQARRRGQVLGLLGEPAGAALFRRADPPVAKDMPAHA